MRLKSTEAEEALDKLRETNERLRSDLKSAKQELKLAKSQLKTTEKKTGSDPSSKTNEEDAQLISFYRTVFLLLLSTLTYICNDYYPIYS